VSVNATYSTFSYTNNSSSFNTRGLNFGYNRQLSKELSFEASAGPQWVNSFIADPTLTGVSTPIASPARLNAAANASLSYTHKHMNASAGYSRGVNAGSGVQVGGLSDSISAQVQRNWGRSWAAALSAGYSRTTGLVVNGTTSSLYTGAQVSRGLGRNFSVYGSYTAIHQSIPASLLNQNAFSGLTQSVGVGVTFSPRTARLGQF
jgi:hypothetical protein